MLRELLSKFSGGQLTWLATIAILVPGTVGAAVAYQPVSIVDPSSGAKAYVDAYRRVSVYDPIAGYQNNPVNFVEIAVSNGNKCDTGYQYAVPAGKALVITAISGYKFRGSFDGLSQFYVYDGPGCTGKVLTNHSSQLTQTDLTSSFNIVLGTGIPVKAGKTVSVLSINNLGYVFLHGYLVPAGAVPAGPAAGEPKGISAAEVNAKLSVQARQ